MIKILPNSKPEIARRIYSVFQLSYAVEAKILGAEDFSPLKRPLESYLNSNTQFYGYFKNTALVGVIEVEPKSYCIEINSLVIHPKFFRRGIATQLLSHIFDLFESEAFTVETGADNTPATELYKKLSFEEVKAWNTEFGIRKILLERIIK